MDKESKPARLLEQQESHSLQPVPSEIEWIKERQNRSEKTASAYQFDINEFKAFVGIKQSEDYRRVTRNHVVQWITHLRNQDLSAETINRKLSAVSSLFKYFCERFAIKDNPCSNITRPKVESNVGKTDAISDVEAKKLLNAPSPATIQGIRDRAILAVFLYHGLRRAEVRDLKVNSIHQVRGVPYLRVKGKGSKTRDLPLHPVTIEHLNVYLNKDGRINDLEGPLFCPLKKRRSSDGAINPMSTNAIYEIVMRHARSIGINTQNFHPHSLRATFATNTLSNHADLGKVQDYLGHASVQTTRIYDKRKNSLADSPTFKVNY